MTYLKVLFSVLVLATSLQVNANNKSYSVDYIRGEGDVEGIKIALQYHTDYAEKYIESLHLYVESSINFWEYGNENIHESSFVLALSPVFQYPIGKVQDKDIFLEFGIGLSLIDDTRFAGKDISTHYQFEDRLGIMTRFGKNNENQLSIRYFHYSNAGFKKPNPGLDFISLSYMRYF